MKFSRLFLFFCTLTVLSSCAYVIPPEENAPRSNTVLGEPHRPQLNNNGGAPAPQSAITPHHYAPQPMAALPPVDATTQAQAEQVMAQQAPAAAPAVMPQASMGAKRVPNENTQFQMSANDDYPSLKTVPSRPVMSGPDSAKERLGAVQSDLVQDRANAAAAKATLSRDAAAEPSMLAPMPQANATMPANDPVVVQPVVNVSPAANSVIVPAKETVRTINFAPQSGAAPAPQANVKTFDPLAAAQMPMPTVTPTAPATSMATNDSVVSGDTFTVAKPRIVVPQTTASYIATTPNVPNFAPPAPMNTASVPAVRPVAYAAPLAPAPAPVILARPVSATPVIATQDLPAPTMTAVPVVMASATRPMVKKGDFDPLAAADNAPIASPAATTTTIAGPSVYASDGYMAPSRYAGRY